MAGETPTVSNARQQKLDERKRDRMVEKAARARYLIAIADEFRYQNIGRTEMERLTGSLRHVGELRAAIMAYDAMEKGKR